MVPAPATLPTRFPCWCRAVYSFSGESKRDLGFIEGDLIECLNAGDGSWWMGRLRRDKRMMGLFPSNFVQVLDESFRPTSRTSSAIGDRSPSPNPFKNPIAPTQAKNKSMRKPFQAYAAPDMGAIKRAEAREKERLATLNSRIPSPAARGGHKSTTPRASSPQPPAPDYQSRVRSPAPLSRFPSHASRAASPSPSQYISRAPSPGPNQYAYRAPSPGPSHYAPRAPSPDPNHYITHAPSPGPNHYTSRGPSPIPNHYASRGPSPIPDHYISRGPSPTPYHYTARIASPAPNQYTSRAPSPTPHHYSSRAPSPNTGIYGAHSRSPSPAPSFGYQSYSRGPSPAPQFDRGGTSSPPPPPPPHRSTYMSQVSRDSYDDTSNAYQMSGAISPCPPSPAGTGRTGRTPSPLRSAMDDVMLSLADMGVARESEIPEAPIDPWSPEAFDQTYISTTKRAPRSNKAVVASQDYNPVRDDTYTNNTQPYQPTNTPPPQLSNYVQRMENRLSKMYSSTPRPPEVEVRPAVPPKASSYAHDSRPKSSMSGSIGSTKLRYRKSAYEVGKSMLGRTFTTKTDKTDSTTSSSGTRSTTTNGSASTQMTDKSLMSGPSAGGFSSTSAGSLARKREMLHGRAQSALSSRKDNYLGMNNSQPDFTTGRSQTPMTGISYHSSHASDPSRMQSPTGWSGNPADSNAALGGLMAPKTKKSGFFKRMVESAKTGAASARSSIAIGESSRPRNQAHNSFPAGGPSISASGFGHIPNSTPTNELGTGGSTMGVDWVQVRRDINRSNSLSRIERVERKERCQMMDYPAISPVEELLEGCDGDEGVNGDPVVEPTNFQAVNLSLVDKNTRFINSVPPTSNAMSVATGYICRPYRSDVQRLRAIYIWVSEKITWDDGFDTDTSDSRRVIQTKHGSSEEVAFLVMDMCKAIGIHAEVIRGYLKSPGEIPDMGPMPRPNHFWNAVVIDGEWRMMDCSLASPSHPRRSQYTSVSSQYAEPWWFLARPIEMCWTHIPEQHIDQHLCPPVAHEVLLALPCACPAFFVNEMEMVDYDTSLIRIEDLELVHIKLSVPPDVECVAEVEARAFDRDADGDLFETGEIITKRALAQAEWVGNQKRYTIKGLLPGDEGSGILKIYAGKRGLMHSIKDIPHALALALPIIHSGDNPSFEFLTRHPTPHAQRHDLYVAQPQCQRLAINNTFVFAVRQHPSSLSTGSPDPGRTSPIPFIRPNSAMSITSSSASGSGTGKKPAKLAIQAPGGKILRLMRKEERNGGISTNNLEGGDGGTWETIIKCGERGVWRGLVLADRSARWCVFAEWTCV